MPRKIDTSKQMLTPPQIAEMFRVDVIKVHAWIKAGELLAFNGATRVGERPRYLIDPADLEIFKRSRMIVSADKPISRARKAAK